jgi:hypothetical protein
MQAPCVFVKTSMSYSCHFVSRPKFAVPSIDLTPVSLRKEAQAHRFLDATPTDKRTQVFPSGLKWRKASLRARPIAHQHCIEIRSSRCEVTVHPASLILGTLRILGTSQRRCELCDCDDRKPPLILYQVYV